MKRKTLPVLLIGLICLVGATDLGAVTLYDEFDTDHIKKTMWQDHLSGDEQLHEFVREIDADRGVLVMKLGTYEQWTPARNSLSVVDDGSLNRLKADVKVMAMNIDTSPQGDSATVFARLAGYFYNKNAEAPTDRTGDIFAEVCIGDQGSGLEAWYTVTEITGTGEGQTNILVHQVLATGLENNKSYSLDLKYNDLNGFEFEITDGITILKQDAFTGPERTHASAAPQKGLGVGVHKSYGEWVDGYIHAEFDNVHINDPLALHDEFGGPLIDSGKWAELEHVRDIREGAARLDARGRNDTVNSRLDLRDAYTPYLEATVSIKPGSQMDAVSRGRAQIGGFFYNQTHTSDTLNGHEGEVWAQVSLELDADRPLRALAILSVANADQSQWTTLYASAFQTAVEYGQEYILAIEFTGDAFIFRCNDEVMAPVPVETPMHPTSDPMRVLESVVYLLPGDTTGYLKASFDKVRVADPTYDANGEWLSVTSNIELTGDNCDPVADQTVLVEAAQNGSEIIMIDTLGKYTGGVISGSRILGHGSLPDGGLQSDVTIDAAFSDADHAAGLMHMETTNGCFGQGQVAFTRTYMLTIETKGQGTVATDPEAGSYASGTVVNLTATPADGYQFERWVGNVADPFQATTTIAMTDHQAVTAYFVKPEENYDLTVNITGQGTVALDPEPGPYPGGTTVGLTATAADGWIFILWEGDVMNPAAAETTILMAENEALTALFVDKALDSDADAVPDYLEYGPDGNDPAYDGNGDGVADSAQANVTSCPTAGGLHYITLAVDAPLGLANVAMIEDPSAGASPNGLAFEWGYMRFTITNVDLGGAAAVKIYLPAGSSPETYYNHGPTGSDAAGHWYHFDYHPATKRGVELNGNVITVHYQDGESGDNDMADNGEITNVGGPAVGAAVPAANPAPIDGGGGGGGGGAGCFINALK